MMTRTWRDRQIYLALGALAFVVLVQSTLLARARLLGAQADLLLVVVICWSLLHGATEGLLLAFLGGLGLDIAAGLPLGTSPLALMPVCFLATLGRTSVHAANLWLPVILVAVATPLHGWIMLLLRQFSGMPVDWGGATVHVILPALILNVTLTLVVARVLRWAFRPTRLVAVG